MVLVGFRSVGGMLLAELRAPTYYPFITHSSWAFWMGGRFVCIGMNGTLRWVYVTRNES
jgi:hypothetical protein